MSKTAIKTAWIAGAIVMLITMYGHGYHRGKNAQLTFDNALAISKAQFECKMVAK